MTSDPMQFQREYQQQQMPIKPGHVKSKLVILGLLVIIGYVGIWNYWPTSALANIPYCVTDLFASPSVLNSSTENTISGVYKSERLGIDGYIFLRFYNDGTVLTFRRRDRNPEPSYDQSLFIGPTNHYSQSNEHAYIHMQSPESQWRYISKWFIKTNNTPSIESGEYVFQNNKIVFTTYRKDSKVADPVLIEWAGLYSKDVLVLTRVEHWPNAIWVGKTDFTRFNVEQCPFNE